MKCLVVDDDLELLTLIQHYLCQKLPSCWTVYGAHTAFKARQCLYNLHGVNVLITDRHMPTGETGIALIYFTAQHWPETRFVLMSSDAQAISTPSLPNSFDVNGIQGRFLRKPFPMKTLLHYVQQY